MSLKLILAFRIQNTLLVGNVFFRGGGALNDTRKKDEDEGIRR